MNKLQIAQKVNTLAGTQGTVDTTEVTGGYQVVLVQMVDQAYNDIQMFRDEWKFLWNTAQKALTSSVNSFTDSNIAKVDVLMYDDKYLREVDYYLWLKRYNSMPTGKPEVYTRNPNTGEIILNPLNDDYLVDVYYWAVPDVMTANTSQPVIPVRFQDVIVYKALIDLGTYLGQYDLIQGYTLKYSIELGHLMRSQLRQKRVRTRPFVLGERY